MAAHGKFQKWLTEDGLLLLRSFARDGLTDEEIAERLEIGVATLYRWKKTHKPIAEALKGAKELYDNEVVEALHKRTLGYTVQVKKNLKLKTAEFETVTGKKIRETEKIVTVRDEVHVPADTMAQMYWLNNRMSERWSARPSSANVPDGAAEEAALIKALTDVE